MQFLGKALAFLFLFALFIWLFHTIDTAGDGAGDGDGANRVQAASGKTFDSRKYELTERETGVRHANPARGELSDDWGG